MLDRRAVILGGLALSGCAAEPRLSILDGPAPGRIEPVYVATSRAPVDDPALMFEGGRSDDLHYYKLDISVPPVRDTGELRYPNQNPDPQREFMALDQRNIGSIAGFKSELNGALDTRSAQGRIIVVYVHGYNVTYPEAVFRAAQLRADLDLQGPTVLYSWPSAGSISLYAYDRDSALFARNGLADLLIDLATTRADKIIIMAHSMGCSITMEALRTLSLSRRTDVLRQLDGVVLASPDIDVDVFRSQIEKIDVSRLPIIVMASSRDRVLWVSQVITGGHPRVGAADNIPELSELGVIVLDLSGIDDGEITGHTAFASSPTLLAIIGSGQLETVLQQGNPGGAVLLQGVANASFAIAYLPVLIFSQ